MFMRVNSKCAHQVRLPPSWTDGRSALGRLFWHPRSRSGRRYHAERWRRGHCVRRPTPRPAAVFRQVCGLTSVWLWCES